nr:reverse transcriptase domain-containing protein [Tanacetum cinerariifolium]
MAALVISISSDVSVESVGSSFLRVILIGSISIEVSVAPDVRAAAVASPVRVLELDTHSLSETGPSKSSPPPVTIAPMVSPFLCSDDSESNIRCPRGKPCRALTRRNSVRPLPSHRLALRDSSFESYAGPSHKRCRSLTTTMTSSIHAIRVLVPFRVDLLPPCKRFRDYISLEDSVKEDIDVDVLADIKADATADKVTVDRDVEAGVESSDRGTLEVGVDVVVRIDIPDGMLIPNAVEHLEKVASLERSNARLLDTMMIDSARADRQIHRFCYYDRMRFRRSETFAMRHLGLVWWCDRLVSRTKVIENQVMAALVISISSDVSVESVGSSFLRVILIGSISIDVSVAPDVRAAAVASPVGVLELDTHSLSETGPSKSSPPPVTVAPMVSPFLCSDDSESNTKMPERQVLPTPHDDMLSRALTRRNSVRPLPSHRLALRYTSHHLDRFTSGSSSGHSSSDHSSSRNSISSHSLSGHTSPDTTIANSSTPPRFVYPPLARASRSRDSFFESSAGPSHKRCRSLTTTMTSSIHAIRVLVPFRVDLLPPCKRFRDSISLEDSVKEDIDVDVLADIKADATANKDEVEDKVESSDRGTLEVGVDVVARIDIPDGMLIPNAVEHLEKVASLERSNARLLDTVMIDSARADSDGDNGNEGNGNGGNLNGENGNGGNVNGGNVNGGNENPNENDRGARLVAQEGTYQDFIKCQPLNFKGTEGVVGLIRWFEKIETVFHISNCPEKYQVKYATCTLLNNALTWGNSHKRAIGTEAAFAMS